MSPAVEEPRLVHALPGRLRVRLAGWQHEGGGALEGRLRQVSGVRGVRANPLTGNVLISFDTTATDEQTILAALRTLQPKSTGAHADVVTVSPVLPYRHGQSGRPASIVPRHTPDVARAVSVVGNERPGLVRPGLVDLILKGMGIAVGLILADSPLGLLLGGVEVLQLFMEAVGHQGVWRRTEDWHEHRLLVLIVPGEVGAADGPEPLARGRTGRDARLLANRASTTTAPVSPRRSRHATRPLLLKAPKDEGRHPDYSDLLREG